MDFKKIISSKIASVLENDDAYIDRPEIRFSKLYTHLSKLKTSSLYLHDKKIEEQLDKAISRTFTTDILYKRNLLAVAGTQGVGKTTLVKTLYKKLGVDLDGLIPETEERGESKPIAIIECEGIKEITCYENVLTENKEGCSVERIEVDRSLFAEKTRVAGTHSVLFEIHIPKSFFGSNYHGFLLLPGFEVDNHELSTEIEYFLRASTNILFVVTSERLADNRNQKLMEDLFRRFKSSKPVVAVSWSDTNYQANLDTQEQLLKEFKFNHDQVHLTCADELLNGLDWIEPLHQTIKNSMKTTNAARQKQLEDLSKFLRDDVNPLIQQIKTLKQSKTIGLDLAEMQEISQYLKHFDEAVKNLKENILSTYQQKLSERGNAASSKVSKSLVDESMWTRFLDFANNHLWPLETQMKFQKVCQDAWENGLTHDSKYDLVLSLNTISNRQFQVNCLTSISAESRSADSKELVGNIKSGYASINKNVVQDLNIMFNSVEEIKGDLSPTSIQSINVAPAICLEMMKFNMIRSFDPKFRDDLQWFETSFMGDMTNFKTDQGKFFAAVGVILGVDAMDGEIDSISSLMKLLSNSPKVAAAANVVGAMVVAAGTINAVLSQMSKYQISKAQFSKLVFDEFKVALSEDFENSLDALFLFMRERAMNSLMIRFNASVQFSDNERLSKAISDVDVTLKELRERINEKVA